MKIKFGSFIVGGSGKVGGHVVSHNKGGQYIRTKVKPTNPRSTSQLAVRSRFSSNSKNWITLTDVQRNAWNSATELQKKLNAMGDYMILSGKALYSMVNQNLGLIGATLLSTPVAPGAGFSLTTLAITAVHATGVVTATFTPVIPATHNIVVMATSVHSPGISFVKNKLRVIGTFGSTSTSPLVLTTQYAAKFGAPGAVGQKIAWKIYAIEIASGLPSQGISTSTTIS
jgi:hypothetical protein